MKHDWETIGERGCAHFTRRAKRQCKNCEVVQEAHPKFHYDRIIGYLWRPLAGRCKGQGGGAAEPIRHARIDNGVTFYPNE